MKKIIVALLLAAVLMANSVMVAGAITDGYPDGNGHPYVVLLLMEVNGEPAFRCSGTLLSATVLLTAGHCAGEPGEFSGMRVFAESNVQTDSTYPNAGGPNTYEAVSWEAHPLFTEASFIYHDVGVVILKDPRDRFK